jgi:hypothetical protein
MGRGLIMPHVLEVVVYFSFEFLGEIDFDL